MGRTEEIILRTYEAFRRGDLAGVIDGWHDAGELRPLPAGRSYKGRDAILHFLERGIHELDEFDFRVYTVLEQGDHALIFGRYSVMREGAPIDRGIFWIAHVPEGKVDRFEAFENVGDAMVEFKRSLGLSWA